MSYRFTKLYLANITACICLVMAVVCGFSVNTVFAQVSASELAKLPKARTDTILGELDGDGGYVSESTSIQIDNEASGAVAQKTLRISPYSTLYVSFTVKDAELDSTSDAIIPSQKIYQIGEKGYLVLENIGRFKLSGLTESEAELRLSAEPVFANMDIKVSVLPVDPDGLQALQPFGHSLFDTELDSTSIGDIPVPMDYVVGPGDEVILQLYGTANSTHSLVVSRDGVIDFPDVGPITVAGQTFEELRENLARLVSQRLIGVATSVTLGTLRSINVLVVGDVNSPGNKVVAALSSVVDVLAASGGISDIGSYRDITIKRGGRVAASVDLYQLLMTGGRGGNLRLQSGDIIFVPPMKQRVYVSGEVNRPAIYQIKPSDNLQSVIALAGGLTAFAYAERVQIERASANKRILMAVDFSKPEGRQRAMRNGDRITIGSLGAEINDVVQLHGEVVHPGRYAWSRGMHLTDIIRSAGRLRRNADRDYSIVKRQFPGSREIQVISLNLTAALAQPGGNADILMQPGDEIFVFGFDVQGQRQYLLSPLVKSLTNRAQLSSHRKVVSVEGGVFEPGFYPLTGDMRVSDLITAAGGLGEGAVAVAAEITRTVRGGNGERFLQHIPVRLEDILAGNPDADLVLQSHDSLTINNNPRWAQHDVVELTGEVMYPGIYPITRGEQLSKLIDRAGGLTDIAFPEGAFLSRLSVKEREAKELLSLADFLEKGMKATVLERQDENLRPGETALVATEVVELLRSTVPPGRVVIDLPTILEETEQGKVSDKDILLMPGDTLNIPEVRQVVSVVGEVNRPTTHAFLDGASMTDYIDMSGGTTPKAKNSLVYVIHANGAASQNTSWWKRAPKISLGDTVIVPMNVEKIRNLKKWSEISGIFGNFVSPATQIVGAAALWKSAEADEKRADSFQQSVDQGVNIPPVIDVNN